ncbi:MAG: pyridoxal phosphate-dependent aminotransferase [Spirochaetales bacterium]|jgi:aspartate aminotransferase|nr:pyridoxal phosphate-dependent aminotransferase [Spirochaetales bacterium]
MSVSVKMKEGVERSSLVRRMFEAGMVLAAEVGRENVYDFSLGNPNMAPPPAFQEALIRQAALELPGKHGYMANAGLPEVRELTAAALSREQGLPVPAESLIMTCGAGGALNVIFKTILNPGDRVLVSRPYFMEYDFYVDNHGGLLESLPATPDFEPDLGELEKRLSGKTAAVLINSPNNPTGAVYGEGTLRALGDLLRQKSREAGRVIYLISDEPYRKIVFDGITVPPVFPYYENSIIATSYSKNLSIPGERIGYLAVNPRAEFFADLTAGAVLANRILGFVNAPALMQRITGEIAGVSVDPGVYQKKRDCLCAALEEQGWEFKRPQGTFYLFPKAPGGDDLGVIEALRRERILAVPGRGFGLPGYFRLAFCVSDQTIQASLPSFKRAKAALAQGG